MRISAFLLASLAAAGVALAAYTVAANATQQFSCFTSECWRRADVASHPRLVPNATLQTSAGSETTLHDYRGSVLVVNFIYTRCATICNTLGSTSSQLATRFAPEIKQGSVKVISISFDPARDDVENLQRYANNLDRSLGLWQVMRPTSNTSNTALKNTFGIVAINDGLGGFDHNAAFHIVDKTSRLVRIDDINDLDKVENHVRRLL